MLSKNILNRRLVRIQSWAKYFYYGTLILSVSTGAVASKEICKEGSLSPHSKDCNKYYRCNHGSLVKMLCPGGLHFSVQQNGCVVANAAGCSGTGTSAPAPAPSTTPGVPVTTPTSLPTVSPNPPKNYKVICYFTDWAIYRQGKAQYTPDNVDPSLCTHIIYSFALLDPTTSLMKIADNNTALDKQFYQKLTAFKSKGVKVSLAIGGWTDSSDGRYSVMVNDPAKRAAFVSNAVKFLALYNFDGLDLDWEYPHCWQGNCNAGPASDKASFSALITELRAALPPGALLSAAVSASQPIINQAYDVPTLSKQLDWIGVMEYDLHTGWDATTGHIAPLYFKQGDQFDYLNVNFSLNYWMQQGADPKKLIMGIPLYGNSFTLTNISNNGLNAPAMGPGQPGPFTVQAGMLAYYEICNQMSNSTVVFDLNGAMGPVQLIANQWISYDDALSVQWKASYIKSQGLAGAMVWALDFDDFTGGCGKGPYPILTALMKSLNG